MKGGSFMLATSQPLMKPHRAPQARPQRMEMGTGNPIAESELPHDDGGEHHDGADRQVDAGGENDQRLGRTNDADDGNLLQDEGQRKAD